MKPAARMALGRVALLTASLAAANVAARAALESRAFGDRLRVGSAGWRAIWLARPPHGEQLGLAYDTHDPELGWTLASGLRPIVVRSPSTAKLSPARPPPERITSAPPSAETRSRSTGFSSPVSPTWYVIVV